MGDELGFSNMPTAATQPIHNIFYPTSTIDENINFNHLLNTSSGGYNAAQATPVTGAVFGGNQHTLFHQEF